MGPAPGPFAPRRLPGSGPGDHRGERPAAYLHRPRRAELGTGAQPGGGGLKFDLGYPNKVLGQFGIDQSEAKFVILSEAKNLFFRIISFHMAFLD
jgi:hypothetical protein